MHKPGLWWGPPQNFDDRKDERKISWLELFYDLVYVAAIGQLTYQVAHISLRGVQWATRCCCSASYSGVG